MELSERCGGLRAGDRAPDAPFRGAAGQSSRLFQLFKGPHWTLLVDQADREMIPPRPGLQVHYIGPQGDVIDTAGYIRDAYGLAPGESVLIRPDGYVGATFDANRTSTLETYLACMGMPHTGEEPK
jgi:hypothetical protein